MNIQANDLPDEKLITTQPTQMVEMVERYWRWLIVATWLGLSAWLIFTNWDRIQGFALGDTDDNMRMNQVRALLAGQDWFDLRQYKMNPPFGANIHWSRLVDLPLAGLILVLRPFIGGPQAEMTAVAIAPLLPLLPILFAITLTIRRLVSPAAWPLALITLFFAKTTLSMVTPLRIDHHGWQLALLAIAVSGMTDKKRLRGGLTTGIASALSLAIGLEMMIYIALAGVATTLCWVADQEERRRLTGFAIGISGGCIIGFAGFASYANRLPVCDALSPVWLSDAVLASALLLGMALINHEKKTRRLALAAGAGIIVIGFHALFWTHCLTRLEGVSPEVATLWLDNVREARSLLMSDWQIITLVVCLPIAGLVGYLMLWHVNRGDQSKLRALYSVAITTAAAFALMAWQNRTSPAAQMLAIPGAVGLIWILAPRMFRSNNTLIRVLGTTTVVLAGFGALIPAAINFVPQKPVTAHEQLVNRAERLCPTLAAMKPVGLQPAGTVFTFIDLAPRLITITHHKSITGPYHRNGNVIADVMHAFRGSPDQAHRIIQSYHADYLLTCPNMSGATIYQADTPTGFYSQIANGKAPAWLQPILLPKDNPLKMWKIIN